MLNFWKWVKKFDHQDFQILKLGSPETSWFWQLVQALFYLEWLKTKTLHGTFQAKKCLQTYTKCADSHHPAHVKINPYNAELINPCPAE